MFDKEQLLGLDAQTISHERDLESIDKIYNDICNHVNGRNFNHFDDVCIQVPFTFMKHDVEHTISIQASKMHYSIPRDNVKEYVGVEIMPLSDITFTKSFKEKYDGNGVYTFVPIKELANELYYFINDDICGGCGETNVMNSCCEECKNGYPELTEQDIYDAKEYYKNWIEE